MADSKDSYPMLIGSVFLFNLLLGTGVLTMPAVFASAGYVFGILVIALLCFISYMQTTFVIETMANANFVKRQRLTNDSKTQLAEYADQDNDVEMKNDNVRCQIQPPVNVSGNDMNPVDLMNESNAQNQVSAVNPALTTGHQTYICSSLSGKFDIDEKFEIGNMTEMFLNKFLSKFFFVSIIVYLFGDLLIYNSMMSKSLRELACTSKSFNCSDPNYLETKCWDSSSITRHNAYRIFLIGFIAILGPLTYAKIQKTTGIQVLTIVLRWAAFISMFGITVKIFVKGEANGHPNTAQPNGVPNLFGICVYSFMCHHSLPSIISPIKNKNNIFRYIFFNYLLVIGFYLLIVLTGIFAFEHIDDVYTLNFQINKCSSANVTSNPADIPFFNIFLPTFPIFTLFSSYTVIALTLINNMKVLFMSDGATPVQSPTNAAAANTANTTTTIATIINYSLPLVAVIPPLIIALFTEDVGAIVQYVGSYSGTLIQYVFPTLLVYYSRQMVHSHYLEPYVQQRTRRSGGEENRSNIRKVYRANNPFASPFQSMFWIYATGVWWVICLTFVTITHIRELYH